MAAAKEEEPANPAVFTIILNDDAKANRAGESGVAKFFKKIQPLPPPVPASSGAPGAASARMIA